MVSATCLVIGGGLRIWPILMRLAPKAKLSDLSDALYEQGWCVDALRCEPTPDTVAEASGENAPGPHEDSLNVASGHHEETGP